MKKTKVSSKKNRNGPNNANDNSPSTPSAVKYQVRNHFTPNMLNSWKMICTLCDQEIIDKQQHLMNECPAIHDSQVKIKDIRGRLVAKRRSKRLFALGEIHDSKD